jgi:hypothetical protein
VPVRRSPEGVGGMSFQARTIRVQFQLGGPTPDQVQAGEEPIIKGKCLDDPASGWWGSCHDEFTQSILIVGAAPAILDAEQLPLLRQRLEAQLQEVDAAEQALKGRGASN